MSFEAEVVRIPESQRALIHLPHMPEMPRMLRLARAAEKSRKLTMRERSKSRDARTVTGAVEARNVMFVNVR